MKCAVPGWIVLSAPAKGRTRVKFTCADVDGFDLCPVKAAEMTKKRKRKET